MNELEFHSYIQSEIGKPFKWGENDCNTFILRMVDHFMGTNYSDSVVGRYNDEKSAMKFAIKIGKLRDFIPLKKVARKHAQTGDIILVSHRLWDRGHVCVGNKVVAPDEEYGTTHLQMVDGDVYRWLPC